MKWVHVVDDVCGEVIDVPPDGRFHPDMVWVKVPEELIDWVNDHYKYTDGVFSVTKDELLRQFNQKLRAVRSSLEGGPVITEGITFKTDRDRRSSLLTSLIRTGQLSDDAAARAFRSDNGVSHWIKPEQARHIADLIADYIQGLFDREATIYEKLSKSVDGTIIQGAALIAAVEQYYDLISTGWPPNEL